ncbi:hypothetical protein, partial [Actinotignum timonense]
MQADTKAKEQKYNEAKKGYDAAAAQLNGVIAKQDEKRKERVGVAVERDKAKQKLKDAQESATDLTEEVARKKEAAAQAKT